MTYPTMIETNTIQKYKATGIDWMPEVPVNWFFKRGKALFKERTMKGYPNESLLAASQKQGVVLKEMLEQRSMEAIQNFESFKLVEKDDYVISLRSFEGGIEFAYFRGIISPVYSIFYFRDGNAYNRDFYKYLFKSRMFIQELNVFKKGIRDGQSISFSEFANIYLPVPPKDEQDEIVQYIKAKEEKIVRFIEKKQRFIELLKEQRQSIIDEAVVNGINPNVKFKNTSFDWLGTIPEHWKIRRLGTIGSFSKGGNISRAELVENGIPAILYGDIYTKYDIEAKSIINRIEEETAANSIKIEKGDLLFTGSGETKEDIGKCIAFNGDNEVYVGGDVIIFKQNEFDSHFISYSQNSSFAKYQKAVSSKGDIIVHTFGSKLRDIVMPYPPTIEEQKQIVTHIKTETATIDTAIAKAEREIELIREYKGAMIAEAVMGKRNK
ncbi:MAG: restriction endonuclease subunit S [Bacteroidetes bacterium]|nr:restriction endonuclease subunit S [Bacteroidota bacterium]